MILYISRSTKSLFNVFFLQPMLLQNSVKFAEASLYMDPGTIISGHIAASSQQTEALSDKA